MTPHGPAIRAIRRLRGLSLREFAQLIGRDPGYWSRVETSQQGAGDESLRLAATALDVPIEAITAITQEPTGEQPQSAD